MSPHGEHFTIKRKRAGCIRCNSEPSGSTGSKEYVNRTFDHGVTNIYADGMVTRTHMSVRKRIHDILTIIIQEKSGEKIKNSKEKKRNSDHYINENRGAKGRVYITNDDDDATVEFPRCCSAVSPATGPRVVFSPSCC